MKSKIKSKLNPTRQMKLIVLFILFFNAFYSSSQTYANKEFYLIDSLDLSKLSDYDLELIDTSLTIYHKATTYTSKFKILEHIVDECWNSNVWPRYNQFLLSQINIKLSKNCSLVERNICLGYLAGTYSNIGFLSDQKGDLMTAIDFYHKSLNIYEYVGDDNGSSTIYNNLGVIYSTIGDTSKSLEYHNKSLLTKKMLGNLSGIAMSYNNIGTIYENTNQPFIALEYYESSLKLRQQINDERGLAMSYDNMGDIYLSQNFLGKAYEFYNKGYLQWKSIGNEIGISTSLNNLANVLLKLNRNDEAKKYALESFEIAKKLDYAVDIENSTRTLAKIYNLEKNYELALKYLLLNVKMKEKTRGFENNKIALKKSMQYEYEKEALKDSLELEKEREIYHLQIQEKETQTYALYGGIVLLLIILVIAIRSFIRKKQDNKKINEQRIKVETQKLKIEKQHINLTATHKEISDSITYAKRIQDAILPTKNALNNYLKNGFVFFQPKDVVSGDFYWIEKVGNKVIFAAADCTGHGVPGAMVSVVCHNALNRAVREFDLISPAKILDKTREIIIETFAHNNENVKDGMDISICCWHTETNQIEWAGANNPLYIIKNNSSEIEIIAGDKQPVGKFELATPFKNHKLQMHTGDSFYLFSDGYMDQFGGENGKKYKYSRFRKFLLSIQNSEMEEQGVLLEREFVDWKRNLEQLDDVCVIGVKL